MNKKKSSVPIPWAPMEVDKPCAMVEIFSVSEVAHHGKIVTPHIVRKGDLAVRAVSRRSQL